MVELIRDFLHLIGLHNWYVSPRGSFNHGMRACVRCGIVQHKGFVTKKWRTVE